jgi:hypothetical protein
MRCTLIASALDEQGLWNEEDGFYYDVLHAGNGAVVPLRARRSGCCRSPR